MSSPQKPSHEEEEYFARVEIQKRKTFAEKTKGEMQSEDLEKLKQLHWKRCANCGFEMQALVFKGITVDQCNHCGGIFLEAGELEQLAGQESGFISNVLGLFKF